MAVNDKHASQLAAETEILIPKQSPHSFLVCVTDSEQDQKASTHATHNPYFATDKVVTMMLSMQLRLAPFIIPVVTTLPANIVFKSISSGERLLFIILLHSLTLVSMSTSLLLVAFKNRI